MPSYLAVASCPPRPRVTADVLSRPTQALPGSAAKIKVLAARAALGLPLFVAGDVRAPRRQTGVSWCPRNHAWRARLWVPARQKTLHLGLYDTESEALEALEAVREAAGV